MRTEGTQVSPVVAPSAASAAFQVAVVQQKQFEETLERVNEKQTEAVKEELRKAERTEDVVEINNDKILETNESENAGPEADAAPKNDAVGTKVNVSV
jgi:hypothetical protein